MSMTDIRTSFPTEKLDALRFYMGEKEQSIEKELQDYLEKVYEKAVPAQVRKYVENHMAPVSATEQTLSNQQTSTHEQSPVDLPESGDKRISTGKQEADIAAGKTPAANDHSVRPTRRQKEQNPAETSVAETVSMSDEPLEREETQGMSMSM